MALNFISDTEESKKTEDPDVEEEDEDEVSVALVNVLASGNLKFKGADKAVTIVDGAHLVHKLVDVLKEKGDSISGDALLDIAKQNVRDAELHKKYVAVSDLLPLRIVIAKKKKALNKKKSSSLLANAWANNEFRTGFSVLNKNEAVDFLKYCEDNIISKEEFKCVKKGEETSIDFDSGIGQIKQAGDKKDELTALAKDFLSLLNTIDNESKKTAYLFGQGSYTHISIYYSIVTTLTPHYTTLTVICVLRKDWQWSDVEEHLADVASPSKKKMVVTHTHIPIVQTN